MPAARIAAVVPAAGQARRFGGGKLMVDLGGRPLIDRTLGCLLDADVEHVVVVTTAAFPLTGAGRINDPRVVLVENPDPASAMFRSVQIGLAAVDAGIVLVLPGDMPFVRPATIRTVAAEARQARVTMPVHAGHHGHPVAVAGHLCARLIGARATSSLRAELAALEAHPRTVEVDDPGVLRDVDTARDLE